MKRLMSNKGTSLVRDFTPAALFYVTSVIGVFVKALATCENFCTFNFPALSCLITLVA